MSTTESARPRLSTYLKRLESESIGIIREVAAEFANPVMLYSIGKDSGVMLHLAVKAFYPSKPPFPLLHVDTKWKFRDMIRHRDSIAQRYGVTLLVYTNPEGLARGIDQPGRTDGDGQWLDLHSSSERSPSARVRHG